MTYAPFALRIHLAIVALASAGLAAAAERPAFDAFWLKFKAAVGAKSSAQVASLSRFPIEMPYGVKAVADAKALGMRFSEVFDGEADAAACFSQETPSPQDKRYEIACGFKGGGDKGDKPIVYSFEFVKGAWKFVGLDNVNE